jgi:hypothetical protein
MSISSPTHVVHLAPVLGVLTLACWIAAGLVAVVGTSHEIRHRGVGRMSDLATAGLSGAGIVSAILMLAVLVFA